MCTQWEDALPEEDLLKAEKYARETDLALCLGTSLRIAPACNIPSLTKKSGGKMCIVNNTCYETVVIVLSYVDVGERCINYLLMLSSS